jgi:siroheme synthase
MGVMGVVLLLVNLCVVSNFKCGVVVTQTAAEALMARFKVELVQTVVETAIVFVEATDAQQAEDLALEIAGTGEPPVEVKITDWKFKDVIDGIEVLSVEELKS